MADQQNSPFDRSPNGYDPTQVAAFAAKALAWKKELVGLRSEHATALERLERYESVIGTIEEVEHEAGVVLEDSKRRASELIEAAERRAAGIVEDAEERCSTGVEKAEAEAARVLDDAQRGAAEVIEAAERRAAALIVEAEDEAARILEMARNQVDESPEVGASPGSESVEHGSRDAYAWLRPEPDPDDVADPVEQIFDPIDLADPADPEAERERRIAAAAANLWKRRGVLSPPE